MGTVIQARIAGSELDAAAVVPTGRSGFSQWFRDTAGEFCARAFIAGLFAVLAIRIGAEFITTGHLTGMLLLVSELLVVVLTIVRRRATLVDRTWHARLVAGASIVLVPLIHPSGHGLAPDLYTAAATGVGLLLIISGKLSLGRSFGLMPAHRGLVCTGIYGMVRHPIYAGYLITHGAFLLAHPSPWNLLMLFVSDASLLLRAVYEERTLATDPEYVGYMARVRWRVLPGVF
jgi:protein-S-isoprenylcysteine O-methyltransferase Ste14